MTSKVTKHLGRIFNLLKSPTFLALTVGGNSIIFMFSIVFYVLEHPTNPLVANMFDAVWWAFATVTTVGYGDLVPITYGGKALGILLMLVGTGLFATYTALFANAFLGREFSLIDRKMRVMKKNFDAATNEMVEEEDMIIEAIEDLKLSIENLDKKIKHNRKK